MQNNTLNNKLVTPSSSNPNTPPSSPPNTPPPSPPKLGTNYSIFEEPPSDEPLYGIWGVSAPVINYIRRNTEIQDINIKEKYEPNEKDNIKILSLDNFNLEFDSLISHASLIIHSHINNKKYSIGFGSGNDNKLCIYSPDPVLITFLRNYRQSIDNVQSVYAQDGIDDNSIEKLNTYLNANDTTVLFPARRPVLKVCYNSKDYKRIFSRQQNGFNCWTALEDIFPRSTESINALRREMIEFNPRSLASLFRGGQRKCKRNKSKKCKRNKSKKCKRNKSKRSKRNKSKKFKRNKKKLKKRKGKTKRRRY